MTHETLQVLEYFKVLRLLARHAATEPGRERALQLGPLPNRAAVETAWQRIGELLALYEKGQSLPLEGLTDLGAVFQELHVAGTVLAAEVFPRIAAALDAARRCRQFCLDGENVPALLDLAVRLTPLPHLRQTLGRCLNAQGEIMDNASEELHAVRREIRMLREAIRGKLERLMTAESRAKAFQERYITQRNGRYVVPVRADFRGLVRGFIHDESSSGQTLFIEPAFILNDNNQLQSALRREQREMERILRELTELTRQQLAPLTANQEILADLDLAGACARFALACQAVAPALADKSVLELRQARHPLLIFTPDGSPRAEAPVPMDILLDERHDTLIVSGPNTGGKSVSVKTAGLLVLMARCGLYIPCHPDSRLFLFPEIFADIGDEQSLEANLSTFSGHLARMRTILEQAGPESLVLLDEAGTGTDPAEGGALVMACLDTLRSRGARIILSTHLNLLKSYAFLHEGIESAAVIFDDVTLRPTYQLRYGAPGSSNAFAIARLMGLPEELLEHASGYLGREERAGSDLLAALNHRQLEMERELEAARHDRQEAAQHLRRVQTLREELEVREASLTARLLEQGRRRIAAVEQRLRQLLDEAAGKKPDTRRQAQIRGEMNALKRSFAELEKGPETEGANTDLPFRPGMALRLRGSERQKGTLLSVRGETAELLLNGKRVLLPLARLERCEGAGRRKRGAVEWSGMHDSGERRFFPELKLVGQRLDDAIPALRRFLDDARLHGIDEVAIVHGSGEGILRHAVHEQLAREQGVKSFFCADAAHGGTGVTIARFVG